MTTTTQVEIRLKRPFAEQQQILDDPTRFKVLAIGRRWGKTETLKNDMVDGLLTGQAMWFCSPTNKNNKRVYPQMKALFRKIPAVYTNDTDMLIRFPTGGFLQFVSLHEADNLRGDGLDRIYVDEAAFIKNGVWDTVLRPMIVTTRGGATFSSSPNGTGNDFHRLFLRGLDPNEHDWTTYHLPSSSSPLVPNDELEDIRGNTPERVYQQEYMAAFLDDGGAVFRNLTACIRPAPTNPKHVVFGVDWGRSNDFTVIVALDAETGHMVAMDRFNQIDWTMQRNRLMAMYERLKPRTIIAEANSIGGPNIEELKKRGLPVRGFTTTQQSKAEIINSLALNLEQETIGILDNPELLGELQAYTIESLPSGNYRYNAPAGLHDDCVIALALANKARLIPRKIFI